MDDIVGGDEDAHFLVHRNHQRVVDFEEVVLPLLRLVLDLVARRRQIAVEGNVVAQIVVPPLPLVPSGLNGHIGAGRVFHREYSAGRRKCQAHDDQKGNGRPEDRQRSVVAELLGLMPDRSTMPQNRVEHECEYAGRNGNADA